MTTLADDTLADALAAFREIAKQYGNQDLNHVDFRVAAKMTADAMIDRLQGAAVRASASPPGWKLVPIEPTPDMRIAGGIAWSNALPDAETYVDSADAGYKAMIAAAPSIQTEG